MIIKERLSGFIISKIFNNEKNSEIKPPKKTRFDHLYENSKILQEKKEIYRIKSTTKRNEKYGKTEEYQGDSLRCR